MDLTQPIRDAALAILGDAPTAAQHRALAEALRDLAADHEQRAAALESPPTAPPRQRPGPKPARFVRIDRRAKVDTPALLIGKGLYADLAHADPSGQRQPPPRIDLRQVDDDLQLVGLWADAGGYAVTVGKGMPRFYAAGSRALLAPLADGRYEATVHGNVLTLGAPRTA